MKKYNTGIYVGKFMPLHKGHLQTVLEIAKYCDKVYMVFYNDENKEKKLAEVFDYNIEERISDAKELLKDTNIEVVDFVVPSDIKFPRDYKKVKEMLFNQIGVKNINLQIFGKEEEEIYKEYIYADKYITSEAYILDDNKSLHATLIRENYKKYSKYLPDIVKNRLDKRYNK